MIKLNYTVETDILRKGECEHLKIEKNYHWGDNFIKCGNTYSVFIKNSDMESEICRIKRTGSKWSIIDLDSDIIGCYANNEIIEKNVYVNKTLKDVINMITSVLNKYFG